MNKPNRRLEGKIALITGAGSGIGEACMTLFAREGATVVGCGRRIEPLECVVDTVKKEGGSGQIYQADLAQNQDAVNVVQRMKMEFGGIDILIHSAGVGMSWAAVSEGSMNDIAATPHDKWQEVMQINLEAYYSICNAALPMMLERGGGNIVAVSSVGGLKGSPSAHTYAAAKAAVVNLTQSMAITYGSQGVRANCVCPGLIDTPMVENIVDAMGGDEEFLTSMSPMQRLGTAMEVAYGCLYLASDESSYCNGVILPIDGGATAR